MNKDYHFSMISSISVILVLSFFSLIATYSQNSEISVIVNLINGDKFIGQTWDINAQLKDKF